MTHPKESILVDLKHILATEIVVNKESCGQYFSVKFTESSPNSKIKEIEIKGLPKDSLVFTLDYVPQKGNNNHKMPLTNYINQTKDFFEKSDYKSVRKSCDYVIAYVENDILHFVLCEIKSENNSDAKAQLENTEIFLKYLVGILEKYTKNELFKNQISQITYMFRIFKVPPSEGMRKETMQQNGNLEKISTIFCGLDKNRSCCVHFRKIK